ncbi:efflux RND transporter periplasmic adaptor subunit [Luteolibacter ambystomatis]|uniref:Efflux RND transporter periplasmic adaptor subunit n=1 Tax=Luteolibacter ambystomatis TaxID=2824561 RepID=A0A975J1A3_9BACT|nr:efflux RND transporter periplasmic adaptor subunit [Luteolibacter ambystomatis]QUE52188.1 efflux RND transporter periplasmic adaptor subunit [Luteolibacter ambystomatis]
MKPFLITLLSACTVLAADTPPVILDEAGVKNLGIETVETSETTFEETAFALGRIEEIPSNHAVLSSRIAGRILEMKVFEGDVVTAGQPLVKVESRQPGDPPPSVELKSPIAGLVSSAHVRLGEPVEPEKELLDISDLTEVLAVARVPEHIAGKLKPGATQAHIRVAALGSDPLDGTLLRFGTSADRESGTIDAIFRVPNPGLRMRPGMRTEFSVVLSKRENVISVPREALQGDPASRVVYVKDFDLPNAFRKVPVRIGQMNDRFVEILGGLFPGDEVVTTGSYALGFAGGSGPSLKEALDAAHGHEHNADGSEKTADQKKTEAGGGHGDDHAAPSPIMTRFFMATTAILFVLLVIVSMAKRRPLNPETPEAT